MSKIDELKEEIRDLEAQILDMFEVAFCLAGLKPEYLTKALEYYVKVMEGQDENKPYTAKEIVANILLIKSDKKEWFYT